MPKKNRPPEIPKEIFESAIAISNFFKQQGISHWILCDVASRSLVPPNPKWDGIKYEFSDDDSERKMIYFP